MQMNSQIVPSEKWLEEFFFFQVAWASPVLPESRSQWEQNCKALLLLMFSARTVDVIVHPRVIPYFGLRSPKLPCFALFSLVSMTS